MARAKQFLMAGGGTGGHVIPLLAVARELQKRGHGVVFAGTERGLESKLVPAAGFEMRRIHIGALNRVSLAQKIETLIRLPIATVTIMPLVRACTAVFSMGGYVAGPPVMAALAVSVPLVVMEPNAVPGFTNRKIGRFVRRALISFARDGRLFSGGAHGNHRPAGARGVLRHSCQAARGSHASADHRRQPGIAHPEPGGA